MTKFSETKAWAYHAEEFRTFDGNEIETELISNGLLTSDRKPTNHIRQHKLRTVRTQKQQKGSAGYEQPITTLQ